MQKKVLFVINAIAGKAQIKNHLVSMVSLFNAAGYRASVAVTQQPRDATLITKQQAPGHHLLLCTGGDGTLNEVVNGLMMLDVEKPLIAYIPSGSTNDFAANLYDDLNIMNNTQAVLDGVIINCDIAQFDESYFVYCAAFGAFALTSYETAQINKNIIGRLAYFLEGTKHLNTLKEQHIVVKSDNILIEDDFLYGMVTNSDSVAGIKGFGGRNVQLDDGLFEVFLVRMPKTLFDLQQIISGLIKLDFTSNLFYRFKSNKLSFSSDTPIAWNLDGEFGGERTQTDIFIHHNAVRFLAPSREQRTDPEAEFDD